MPKGADHTNQSPPLLESTPAGVNLLDSGQLLGALRAKAKVAAFVDLYLKTAMVAEQAERLREFERLRHQAQLD